MEEELIRKYESLIYKIAHRFYNVELCDLYQAGCIGLIKAYRNYDSKSENSFVNFAYMYIYGEMYELVNNSRDIKVNKAYLKLLKSITKTKELLYNNLGRTPTLEEISQFLEIDKQQIKEIILNSYEIISLDNKINEEGINILDIYGKEDNIENKILIKESLQELEELEKQVIVNRYFNDMTQSETAIKLGLSQVKVSRLEQKGKAKIKEYINC